MKFSNGFKENSALVRAEYARGYFTASEHRRIPTSDVGNVTATMRCAVFAHKFGWKHGYIVPSA